jgi:hypothetical protein
MLSNAKRAQLLPALLSKDQGQAESSCTYDMIQGPCQVQVSYSDHHKQDQQGAWLKAAEHASGSHAYDGNN